MEKTSIIFVAFALFFLGCIQQQSLETITLCNDTISYSDFDKIGDTLQIAVGHISSLDEFEAWLGSQKCISKAKQANWIIATAPPIYEFHISFNMTNGSIEKKVIDVSRYDFIGSIMFNGGKEFRYVVMHD